MSSRIKVLLVDDQEMVRAGFRMVLDATGDIEVVGEAADGAQGMRMCAETNPDVVLMDVRMPVMDGIEAISRIVGSGSDAKALVLTTFDLDEYVFAALKAGASGFLLKDAGPAELLAAIRAVHSGDAVVAPSATRRLLERFVPAMPAADEDPAAAAERVAALTDREREVLTLVAQGLTNGEIAATLFLAEATVKTHIGHILAKLGLRDRVQMVVIAYDARLVRPRA